MATVSKMNLINCTMDTMDYIKMYLFNSLKENETVVVHCSNRSASWNFEFSWNATTQKVVSLFGNKTYDKITTIGGRCIDFFRPFMSLMNCSAQLGLNKPSVCIHGTSEDSDCGDLHQPSESWKWIVGGAAASAFVILTILIALGVFFYRKRRSSRKYCLCPLKEEVQLVELKKQTSVDIEVDEDRASARTIQPRSEQLRFEPESDVVASAEASPADLTQPDMDLNTTRETHSYGKQQSEAVETSEKEQLLQDNGGTQEADSAVEAADHQDQEPLQKGGFQEVAIMENSDTSLALLELRRANEDPQETGEDMVPVSRNLGEQSSLEVLQADVRRQQGRLRSQR